MRGKDLVVYQGVEGSWCEKAARLLRPMDKYKGVVTSKNVVGCLTAGRAKYGVMAIKNNICGGIAETEIALEGKENIVVQSRIGFEVRHGLYVRVGEDMSEVKRVAGHLAAILQCASNLYEKNFSLKYVDDSVLELRRSNKNKDKGTAYLAPAGLDVPGFRMEREFTDQHSETEFGLFTKI